MEQRVVVLPREAAENSSAMTVMSVNGNQVLLCNDSAFELSQLQRNLGAWFINDTVVGGGGILYMATPVDPIFLVLPLLEQSKGMKKKKKRWRQIFL